MDPRKETRMQVAPEQNNAFEQYAHPERLVSCEWVAEHKDDANVVVLECDEDVLLYEMGHIPGALKIDWHVDLNDEDARDFVNGEAFAEQMALRGINRDDTIVVYGDKSNWWAAYALWVFTLFGHEDVRLMNGGRDLWIAQGRELTREKPTPAPCEYPVVARNDSPLRALRDDVLDHLGKGGLIDVRSADEYTGKRTHMPDYPDEGAMRGGHVPTAHSVPWAKAVNEDGTFRTRSELESLYLREAALNPEQPTIVYCRIGERSSHTWFVLTHLLGLNDVRNYDGSWTEWGNLVGVPIVKGEEPGAAPQRR